MQEKHKNIDTKKWTQPCISCFVILYRASCLLFCHIEYSSCVSSLSYGTQPCVSCIFNCSKIVSAVLWFKSHLVSPLLQYSRRQARRGTGASTWRMTCQRTSPWLKRHHVVLEGDWRSKMAAPEEQELSQAQTEKLLQFQVASGSISSFRFKALFWSIWDRVQFLLH